MGNIKTKIVSCFLIFSAIMGVCGSFFMDPANRWIIWTIVAIIVCALIGIGVYYYYTKIKKTENETEQELLLKQDKNIINQVFNLSIKVLGTKFTSYRRPVYLMIGSEKYDEKIVLSQNGFRTVLDENTEIINSQNNSIESSEESDSYLKFWESDSAIVIQVGHRLFDDSGADKDLWAELINHICKRRSQQPVNGIIYTIGCSFVQTGDKDYHDKVMDGARQAILDFNKLSGVSVPVYLALTNADAIKDFVPFIKTFELLNQNKPLGFNLKNKERHHLDFADYDLKTKQVVEYFSQNSVKFFKNLSEEDSRSTLSFVYELALFFNILKDCLKSLCQENRLKQNVWLRGIYMLIPNQRPAKYDLLSQFVGAKNEIGTDGESQDVHYDKKRYFVNGLFDEVLIPSRNIVGVNSAKVMANLIGYLLKISVSVFILGLVSWWYYSNWLGFVELRKEVETVLVNYEKDITNIDLSTNRQLDDLIMSLDSIRQMNNKLESQNSLFYSLFFEFSHLKSEFKTFYVKQLQLIWLKKMESMMRNNFYYQELVDNTDLLLSGASSYMMLFDKSILDEDYLENYFSLEVLDKETIDINLRPIVKKLDHDLFASDYDSTKLYRDVDLKHYFDDYINSISVEDMLYSMVKLKYSSRGTVNILAGMNKDFNNLLYFEEGYTGYNVPYIFTKEGFLEIDLSPRSDELRRLLKNLKLIKPSIDLSDESLTELAHKVQNLYYNEYSDYWLELLQKTDVKGGFSFTELVKVMDNLASPNNSALYQFLKVVVNNTYLTDAYATNDANKDGEKKDGDNKDEKKNDKTANNDDSKVQYNVLDGSKIAAEFTDYYTFLGVNSKLEYSSDQSVPINVLMQKFGYAAQLIKVSDKTPELRNKIIFDYYSKNAQELQSLFDVSGLLNEDTPLLLSELLTTMHFDVKHSIYSAIASYLSEQWSNRIASFYKLNFANKFPFNPDSDQDVKIENINRFFMAGGVWDSFIKTYISPFVVNEGETYKVISDENGEDLQIPNVLFDNMKIAKEIQEVFFHDNQTQPTLKLKLIPRKMSSNVKKFELDDGGSNNCSYDQGPRLPCTVQWPSSSINPFKLSFTTANNYAYGTTFDSQWGILKVFDDEMFSDFSDYMKNGYQSWVFTYDGRSIVYDVQIVGQENKTLPIKLFQRMNLNDW